MCSGSHRFSLRDPSSSTTFAPLQTWAEQHLSALYHASSSNFSTAFDDFISKSVDVTFNGASLSRADYEQQFQGEIPAERLAVVDIQNIVLAAGNKTNGTQETGAVGMFYHVVFPGTFGETAIDSSFNIFVEEDQSVDSHCGQVDQRRVVSVNQVLSEISGGHGPVSIPPSTSTAT